MLVSNRRRFLRSVGALSLAPLVPHTLGSLFRNQAVEAATVPFANGADVSWLPQMEAAGYVWLNANGVQEDLLTILKEFNVDSIRLRTWVNPSQDPYSGHCSEQETVALAVRCKNAGFRVLLDFHFGDTWNSVGTQNPPAAWANMTYSQMQKAIYDYVFHFMNDLKYNGVTPAWVQLGNEENIGICGPTGSLAHQPAQMTGLINAAHDMVKQVFPSCKTVIHLAQPQNLSSIENWFDTFQANGGQWDVCGFSSYASSSDQPSIAMNVQTVGNRYGKDVMMVEVGGPYNRASTKTAVSQWISSMKSFGGLGVFYWEPECYNWNNYQMGAWDPSTKMPTSILQAFQA